MQGSRQPLKEEVPGEISIAQLKENLHPEDTIETGHSYIYCQRKNCRTWRRMDKAKPLTTPTDKNRWIGVRVYQEYDFGKRAELTKTDHIHDKVAKYCCSTECAVIHQL